MSARKPAFSLARNQSRFLSDSHPGARNRERVHDRGLRTVCQIDKNAQAIALPHVLLANLCQGLALGWLCLDVAASRRSAYSERAGDGENRDIGGHLPVDAPRLRNAALALVITKWSLPAQRALRSTFAVQAPARTIVSLFLRRWSDLDRDRQHRNQRSGGFIIHQLSFDVSPARGNQNLFVRLGAPRRAQRSSLTDAASVPRSVNITVSAILPTCSPAASVCAKGRASTCFPRRTNGSACRL